MAKVNNNHTGNKKSVTEKTGELPHDNALDQVKKLSWWAKLFLFTAALFTFLILLIFIFINIPAVKDRLAERALGYLNDDFGVNIQKEQVEVNIFGDVIIHGLTIKDYKNKDLIKAKELRAESNWFSIITDSRNLHFSQLVLRNADIRVVTYKGDSIDNFTRFIDRFDTPPPTQKSKKPFQLHSRVLIVDSKLSIINQNQEGDAGKWLQAERFNLYAPTLDVEGPKIKARINNLTFVTKRWGKTHTLDTFSTDFSMDREHLSLKDLTLYTDHSLLQGDLTFNLDKKTHWQDFNNKVRWDMAFKRGSALSGYDISYFATKWDRYSSIGLSGSMEGPLNNFRLKDFLVTGKDVQLRTPEARFKNLITGDFRIASKEVSTNLTYPAVRAMLPTNIAAKMKNFADPFGRIQYRGALEVTPQTVIAKGNLMSSIGRADADIVLSDIDKNRPRYEGSLLLQDFNLAALTKNNTVGLVSGKIIVDGSGFDLNTLSLNTKSEISRIDISGKTLNGITLEGTLAQKKYTGLVKINDEHARGKVSGNIDFSTKRLIADLTGNFDHLNLSYFGLSGNRKSEFSGNFDGKASFTTVNDINLDVSLDNVLLLADKQRIEIPSGDIKAYQEKGRRIIAIDVPNVLRGNMYGTFQLGDIGKMFQRGFEKILVGSSEGRYFKGQNFTFVFEANQAVLDYFVPQIKIPEGVRLNGSFQGNTNEFELNADAPSLMYIISRKEKISEADRLLAKSNPEYKLDENKLVTDTLKVGHLIARVNTARPEEQFFINASRVEYQQNVFKDIYITADNENDESLHVLANFKHGNLEDEEQEKMRSYAINLNQSVDNNGDYVIKFDPTEVKLNNFVWNVDTSPELNHSLVYRKKTKDLVFNNIRLFSDNSEIFINGFFKDSKDFTANVEVKNLELSKLLDLLPNQKDKLDLNGLANGTIAIKMNKSFLEPIIDLHVDNMVLNGKNMGKMEIKAQNSSTANIFDIEARIVSPDLLSSHPLELSGTVNNNTDSPTLNLTADLQNFDLGIVQVFVKNIFTNFRGKATGKIAISGTLNDINYAGDVATKNLGLKLNFSGVDYSFQDTTINIDNGNILLAEPIKITDGRNNSSGTLSLAQINLSNLSNIGANILISADNLMLLNTEQKDFDVFWGKIYGKGDLFVEFDNGKLSISAGRDTPTDSAPFQVLSNSVFTLNSNTTSSVEEFKMLRFLKADKTGAIKVEDNSKKSLNTAINILMSIDKGSLVNVLVGDEIGDISVRGDSEKLRFAMKNGRISLEGSYAVNNGTYVSRAILEKTFQIEKGSNLSWDGDPFNPSLNIRANYVRTVSNASEYLGIGNLPPINVMLQTKISQSLKNPKIEFDVTASDVSAQVRESLAVRMGNNDEKTLQFGSVLVLNNFNTTNTGGFGNLDIASTATNTGYNMLLKQLSNVINTISDQFQIDPNLIRGDPNSNIGDRLSTDLTYTASPRWKFKTTLGIPISRTAISNDNTFAGQAELDLSRKNDGSLVLRGYSKPSNIGLGAGINTSINQSYGAGVVYSKSFNSFFKKKKKTQDSIQVKKSMKSDSLKK